MELHSLQAALARLAAARGDPRFDHPRNLALALGAECGAVLDRFKWLSDTDVLALDADIREGVARDAVEAMLYALRLATRMGVDVAAALAERVGHVGPAKESHAGPAEERSADPTEEAGAGPTEEAGPAGSAAEAGGAGTAEEAGEAGAASARADAATTGGDDQVVLQVRAAAREGEVVLQGTATESERGKPAMIVHPAPSGRGSTRGMGSHSRQVESRSGSGAEACMPGVNDGPSPSAPPVPEAAAPRIAPPPAASGMVDAANAAFARTQAAAGRVQRVFPALEPTPAAAIEPPEEDDFDSTITLDAGPAPLTSSVPVRPPAAGPLPAPATDAASGSAVPADDSEPPEPGGASQDAAVRRVDPMPIPPARDHDASKAGCAGSPAADAGERTGNHGGKRAAGRAHDKSSGGAGHGARHPAHGHPGTGRGHSAQRDDDGRDRRPRDEHADPRRGPSEPRSGTAARRPAETRGHGQERPTGQGRHAERSHAPGAEARIELPTKAAGYAKLDLEAVQAMRKSLARHLESLARARRGARDPAPHAVLERGEAGLDRRHPADPPADAGAVDRRGAGRPPRRRPQDRRDRRIARVSASFLAAAAALRWRKPCEPVAARARSRPRVRRRAVELASRHEHHRCA